MSTFSGIYQHYEGTDAECGGVQQYREITWATNIGTSGAARYLDCSGDAHYLYPGPDIVDYWLCEVGGIYFPNGTVRIGPVGVASGITLAHNDANDYIVSDENLRISGNTSLGLYYNNTRYFEMNNSRIDLWGATAPITVEAYGSSVLISGSTSATLKTDGIAYLTGVNGVNASSTGGDMILYGVSTASLKTGGLIAISGSSVGLIAGGFDLDLSAQRDISLSATRNLELLAPNGDIYSNAWQAYSPTISGWDTTPTGIFKYKSLGSLIFVSYSINGSGNGNNTQFTLPYSGSDYEVIRVGSAGYNNGGTTYYSDAAVIIVSGEALAVIQTSPSPDSDDLGQVFGSGIDPKWLCGQFWYQKA